MKKYLVLLIFTFVTVTGNGENRFPKPDFESGYRYPEYTYEVPDETLWISLDLVALAGLMGVVAYSVLRKRKRMPVLIVSAISLAYFGFFRKGCVCSIGAIQNVALALTDSSYAVPLSVLLFFMLPIAFTLLFGRVFCAGVCPFGALQELLNVKNYRIPRVIAKTLEIIPWIYLIVALLLAVTHSAFIICRFDPFIGIFRFGGTVSMILFGAGLLILSIFTGRPFCRFICPYGAILSLFSRVAVWNVKIVKKPCINCDLCRHACHVDAIRPPYSNKIKENRTVGVRRILIYLVTLPLITLVGAVTLRTSSDLLSKTNKKVQLYDIVTDNNEQNPKDENYELEAFLGQGGKVEELALEVNEIKQKFKLYSTVAGAVIGIITGIMLINLSLKRTRKNYEIDDAACVNCGRCFEYCPQNR
ncbi:MAG: 4Fe-4S binding protein [Prevotellaceae bacterium]|jgi:polyferredoxin|nr:4Fe-4S binding protein [Prevotellaceae bacterium]